LKPVQHIHSSFLYKKAAALAVGGWDEMNLSKVGMTEETWFTYKLYLADWKLFIAPRALCWHLKAPVGGTRTDKETEDLSKLYYEDRIKFAEWYKGLKSGKTQT
jgi:GT2 family glycosyltransferase